MNFKNFMITALIVVCAIFAYRIFDLGVSYSYLSDDLKSHQRELKVVGRFQRLPCSSIDMYKDDFLIFQKEGLIVIDGFEFECKLFPGETRKLLYYVGRGK
jgi:hypothetical protein